MPIVTSFEQFVQGFPDQGTIHPDFIDAALSRFQPADSWIQAQVCYSDCQPYGRQLLLASANLEVLIMGWRPSAECLPHDHGMSEGAVLVLAGTGYNRNFQLTNGDLVVVGEDDFGINQILPVRNEPDRHLVHLMGNASPTEPLITLHCYSPPITGMEVFDPIQRRVLTVGDQCGAWVPTDASLIVASRPW